jgi:hypothetical protein
MNMSVMQYAMDKDYTEAASSQVHRVIHATELRLLRASGVVGYLEDTVT